MTHHSSKKPGAQLSPGPSQWDALVSASMRQLCEVPILRSVFMCLPGLVSVTFSSPAFAGLDGHVYAARLMLLLIAFSSPNNGCCIL